MYYNKNIKLPYIKCLINIQNKDINLMYDNDEVHIIRVFPFGYMDEESLLYSNYIGTSYIVFNTDRNHLMMLVSERHLLMPLMVNTTVKQFILIVYQRTILYHLILSLVIVLLLKNYLLSQYIIIICAIASMISC